MDKYFVRANGTIVSLDEDDNLTQPDVSNPPNKGDFIAEGMSDLSLLVTPKTRATLKMSYKNDVEGGTVFSKNVTPSKFSSDIRAMNIK